jgi:hypothetical protein
MTVTQMSAIPVTATHVDFTSHVDKAGYDLIPGKRSYQGWLERESRDVEPDRIRGRGGKQKAVRLDDHPALYGDFASIKTPEELLAFVTQYGPLTFAGTAHDAGDVVDELLDQAKRMEKRFKPKARVELDGPLADVKAWISTDKKGKVSIKMLPSTLLDALWLQLGQSLSGGAKMRECRHCKHWFPVGGDSGRRLVAEFCSEEHKKRFFSLERSRK